MKIKRFNENENESKYIYSGLKDLSDYLGIDPNWLKDYLLECFEFNLDIESTDFSEEKIEDIIEKLRNI